MENTFLEFKVTYDIEKIRTNYKKFMYYSLITSMQMNSWNYVHTMEILFSHNMMEIEIVKTENSRLTLEEEEAIIKTLYKYIIMYIAVDGKMALEATEKPNINTYTDNSKEFEEEFNHHSASMLRTIRQVLSNSSNNSNSSIYRIKEKTEQPGTDIPGKKEESETVLYTISLISTSKVKNQEGLIDLFLKSTNYWNEYTFCTMYPIFQKPEAKIDMEDIHDLKSLYEEEISYKTNLIDYGIQIMSKRSDSIYKTLMHKSEALLNIALKLYEEYNLLNKKKEINILVSIYNNRSDILLEKKITAHCTQLLITIELLYTKIDTNYNYLFLMRYIHRLEDICELSDSTYRSLKKTESHLTKSISIQKENKDLSQDEIEKKIEAVKLAIKCFDTWQVKEDDINKLYSYQKEYIMKKLKEADLIKCPWDYSIRQNIINRLEKFCTNLSLSDIHATLTAIFFFIIFVSLYTIGWGLFTISQCFGASSIQS